MNEINLFFSFTRVFSMFLGTTRARALYTLSPLSVPVSSESGDDVVTAPPFVQLCTSPGW
jgi:hypothetical protein